MKKIFSLLLVLTVFLNIQAQFKSPYKLNLATDITLPVVSLAMIGTAFLLEKKRPGLTVDQINGLDRNTISVFDRNATPNWNTTAAKWSDGLMISTGVLPLLFLIDERSRKDFGKVAMIYSEIFLVNVALTNLTKELVQRKRPYVYNPNVPLHEKMDKDATHSFFSGHVSLTAAMTFGFAQMYQDYFPNSPAKPGVWFGAAVLPLAVAILRNRAGKHFWTDVLVGYVVGAAVGILIPRLHKVKK
jgi:membrane-associated phospholipid phosphatase